MNDVDVFLIHGVQNKIDSVQYFTPFCERILKHFTLEERGHVRFHPVDYSVLLDKKEEEIYSWMKKDHWQKSRWIGCKLICDVLAYAYPKRPSGPGDFIYDVTKLLAQKFGNISSKYPDSRKWLIGHSLGCVVGFGFTWDVKVDGLITFGNPHDYFSIRYKNFGEDNEELAQFFNFHNPWDPISTRVGNNPNFKRVKDIIVSDWSPLKKLPIRAHVAYWENEEMAKKIASIFKSISTVDG